jgi:hypothetical protein
LLSPPSGTRNRKGKNPFSHGGLSLYKAIEYKQSEEIILAILETDKDEITKRDNKNTFPIFKAIQE